MTAATTSGSRPQDSEPLDGNYFVAAYPPFSVWSTAQAPAISGSLGRLQADVHASWGTYIHLPFCEKRCDYCYYLSFSGTPRSEMRLYVERVAEEASLYGSLPRFAGRRPRFVYFGGGTPSLLPADDLQLLLERLEERFPWQGAEEVTFECSPKSITAEKLAMLKRSGCNRISLGVQQLDDDILRRSGRIHLVADVYRAFAQIREFAFAELNVDLIAGLPGQSDASFLEGVNKIIDLAPDCVTIYPLEVPANTPLYKAMGDNEDVVGELAGWEIKRQRITGAFALLSQHGYTIRNAYSAATGQRHQRFAYMDDQYHGADLVGLGLSSFSYVAGMHYQNTASAVRYREVLESGHFPIARGHVLDNEEQMVRELVLQLKQGSVSRSYFRSKFGTDPVERFASPLAELAEAGWTTWDDDQIRLTPGGLVRVDRLLPMFYLKRHQERSYW